MVTVVCLLLSLTIEWNQMTRMLKPHLNGALLEANQGLWHQVGHKMTEFDRALEHGKDAGNKMRRQQIQRWQLQVTDETRLQTKRQMATI